LQIAIWYPSNSPETEQLVGPFDMTVAADGAVSGAGHPLIVMSHGTGGMALNSYGTAIALAQAGFIVASITHTGDNYRDHSTSFTRQLFVDRPRHVTRVIDFMLTAWPGQHAVDPNQIGIFGHSAGGTTALLTIGGIADLQNVITFCRKNPDDWGCQHARQRGSVTPRSAASEPISAPDPRIKAAVLAAPALAVAFQPNELRTIKVPVQLWVGAQDEIVTDASQIRTLLPAPPDYHLITNGGHFAYLAPCNGILQKAAPMICVDPNGFDRPAFLLDFNRSVIAFYEQHLNGRLDQSMIRSVE
jgi:predicted dienelactone hydrolase